MRFIIDFGKYFIPAKPCQDTDIPIPMYVIINLNKRD